jgi:hypothetical protein
MLHDWSCVRRHMVNRLQAPCPPVTVAERFEAWTVFARSDAVIVDSDPTQVMDVWCVYVFILCLGRGLSTGWSVVQGVVNKSGDWKAARARKGCRAIKKTLCQVITSYTALRLFRSHVFNVYSRYSGLDDRGSNPGRGKIFIMSTTCRPTLGPTKPPIQWVRGSISPGVKRSGREADHSPPYTSPFYPELWTVFLMHVAEMYRQHTHSVGFDDLWTSVFQLIRIVLLNVFALESARI